MDSNGNQRKRGGRVAKTANTEKSPSHNEIIENSAVAISPTLKQTESAQNAPAAECRRSSRKKIIKFDVRDLLNKNRKTHKIQIEARIDSNAPTTSKAAHVGGIAAANLKTTTSREDLLSKHKTFLEKSAIFRRYSISQEQKPPPPPLPIPPLLSNSNENKESSFCGTSSSQEFLSHILNKPKEPTSLIVAQIESNKPTSSAVTKRKSLYKSPEVESIIEANSESTPVVQQKKRGRPAKAKNQSLEEATSLNEESAPNNITPEKARNWKEYKACLAQQCGSNKDEKHIFKIREKSLEKNQTQSLIKKQDSFHDYLQLDISRSDDDGSFSGFHISRDDTSCDSPVLEKISSDKEKSLDDISTKTEPTKKTEPNETEATSMTTLNKKETNFAEENLNQKIMELADKEDSNFEKISKGDNKNEKAELSAAKTIKAINVMKEKCNSADKSQNLQIGVEDKTETISHESKNKNSFNTATSGNTQEVKANLQEKTNKYVDQTILDTEKPPIDSEIVAPNIEAISTGTETPTSTQLADKIFDSKYNNSPDTSPQAKEGRKLPTKIEERSSCSLINQTGLPESSTSTCEKESDSRTSSSSESENASDRSTYSSEPFSTSSSSSPRSYKSGDKVKVAMRRISLPKSPSTSSQTSTSEELNNLSNIKNKPPIGKRSKRLQKKLNDSVVPPNTTENIGDNFQKDLVDANKLENKVEKETEVTAKLSSVKTIKTSTSELILCSDESSLSSDTKSLKSNHPSKVDHSPTIEKTTKRKSLRNRKDDSTSLQTDEYPKLGETKKPLIQEAKEKEQPILQELKKGEKTIEISLEKTLKEKNIESETSLTSNPSDKTEDNQSKRTRKARAMIPEGKNQLEKTKGSAKEEEKIIKVVTKEELNIKAETLTEEYLKSLNSAKNMKLIRQDEKVLSDVGQNKSERVPIDDGTARKSAKTLNIQSGIQPDLKLNEKQIETPKPSSPKYKVILKEYEISKGIEPEVNDKTLSSGRKSTEPVKGNKVIATRRKANKEETDLKDKIEPSQTKSSKPEENKVVSNKIKTRKEESSTKPSKDVEEIYNQLKKCLSEQTSSKKETAESVKAITELKQVKIDENVRNRTKSPSVKCTIEKVQKDNCDKMDAVDANKTNNKDFIESDKKQADDEKSELLFPKKVTGEKKKSNSGTENNTHNTSEKPAKDIEKTSTSKTTQQKKDQLLEEKCQVHNIDNQPKALEEKRVETKSCTQIDTKIDETDNKFVIKADTKTVSTRSRKGKEIITTIIRNESPTLSDSQHEVEKIVKQEDCATEKSSKDKKKSKDDSQLLVATPEVKDTKIEKLSKDEVKSKDDNQLLVATPEVKEAKMTSKEPEKEIKSSQDLQNVTNSPTERTSLTRVKENDGKNKPTSPKRTTSKKASNSSKQPSHSILCQDTVKLSKKLEKTANEETSTAESYKPLQQPHSSSTTAKETLNSTSSISSKSSKHSPEASSDIALQGDNQTNGKEKLMKSNLIENTQQRSPLHESKEKLLAGSSLPKCRGRKLRFKNLHGPEDSETDSSNGKMTPIDEIIQEKLNACTKVTQQEELEKEEIKNLQKSAETDSNNKGKNIIIENETICVQEDSKTNLSTSQIKSVSIETNTLLDILRTVQSNTEAALKASKSPVNDDRAENEQFSENADAVNMKESSKNSQDILKIQQNETTFLGIFDAASPSSAAKKLIFSPARSDSNSPLTLKKVTPSPTRSNSSSPLTLKKVTRRYERRSRRGEDSAHKTLEETFAEIAAQSSKAVLAAKEFEEKSPEELDIITTPLNVEQEQVKENLVGLMEISPPADIDLNTNKEKVDEDFLNTTQEIDKAPIETNGKDNDHLEIITSLETEKVTPNKRGRKPKNRSSETSQKEKELVSSKSEEKSKDETKEITKMEVNAKSEQEKDENKLDSKKANESLESSFNENLYDCKGKTSSPLTAYSKEIELTMAIEESLKQKEDITENKPTKKFDKKRETEETTEENSSLSNADICPEKAEEVRTPKQPTKKRDSSLNKSESKSATKKLTKKNKNDEEDSLNLSKEDNVVKNTSSTPPPSKRGRKPKTQQPETPQSSSKKKTKKDSLTKSDDEVTNEDKVTLLENESESSLNTSLEKSLDEKLAKKDRQKKLKEAFEAALADNKEKSKAISKTEALSPTDNSNFGLKPFHNSPPPERRASFSIQDQNEIIKLGCVTPVEPEEDPDPLKDIEKFIADGVNLLKKDYKLDEDSVDDVIQTTPSIVTEISNETEKTPIDDINSVFNAFETPADTPINTPSVTPPPKSPSSLEPTTPDENSGVRRSHRIKLITKTPKALVGRGLVRDRERFSIKDDVETKSHYTLDDHLTDLAEVEAKNAKFLKEMEERLSNFQVIKENEYLCERVISREARKMICDCFLTHEEEDRGELGCGEDCLNRLLMIECGSECNVKERCTNKRFQKWLCSPCRVFRTEKKGFGIMADIEILPGEFIMEYVGEVINTEEFEKRRITYSQEKNRHYYFMALRSDAIIDATIKGNISRFINHSCDPNAETQKWTVNGELRIGFFSRKSIMPGEEITFNYQYQRYGREAQRCYCESSNCTGWIGQEPTSDEGEQMDDEDFETEDEEEEAVTSNLLVQDDEDDSDASVADPEEVQKQLEMAAAQAEAELAPLQLLQDKDKQLEPTLDEGKDLQDLNKSATEEDSKNKFKQLLSKMAEKVAAKQKQNKREKKLQRKKKSKESSSNKLRFLEDPDIEDEVHFLKECGLKNQSDTLRLSRLMVRAKLVQTRLNLLEILRNGDFPCRRLFLDYHGLRLLHGWMSEDAGNMQIRLSLLRTLETLPIANKTVLTDSKVMHVVRTWSGPNSNLSPNEDSSSSNSNSQDASVPGSTTFEESSEMVELQKLALKLITAWDGLPEIFRIPKKERIEQMKEHEREADRQYAANAEIQENITATDRYRRDRFGRGLHTASNTASSTNRFIKPHSGNPHKTANTTPENLKNLSKAQRREMFAAKVARDEAEKRLAKERREFETKCRFFGLDPKKTRTQDMPFCVNPATGQWFSIERKPITTPPSYAHVQVPVKPKSTDPNDYQLPAVCSTLPPQWKYAITPQGKIYFYHVKHRLPQWEPPSPAQLQQCELEVREEESESEIISTAGEDSSDDNDDILIGMDAAQLKAYIDRKVEIRRQKRYQRLVDERSISPRREEDRIYNQIEVRKYKENKEKIRKRKEDIRRKRAEALRQTSLNLCTLGSITDAIPSTSKLNTESDEKLGALPIQDYLLSSDEEIDIKVEVNSPLIDKIVEGDKIVDELDALTTKRQLKRPLPPHRDLSEPTTSSSSTTALISATLIAKQEYKQEYKKRKLEKKEKRKPKEQDAKYRKNKEKFRCEIAGIIVHHLKPYLKETCSVGRIQSNEDFNHLARKLTHFVMIKELKYCESVGQTLVVTESVKSKSREFIKKYMAKYGEVYVKPTNDPDFKDIPFTL